MSEYKIFEQETKKLGYEKNFREWLKENKHLPSVVLDLIAGIEKKGEEKCEISICVTCIDVNEEGGILYGRSFKIKAGNQSFFLKIENNAVDEEGGFQEIQSTLLAKDELESIKAKGVRVANPFLGYTDKKENRSYFVAEWLELPVLYDVINKLKKQQHRQDQDKADELLKRVESVQKILNGFREVSPSNMFYDKQKDEIVIFDLHI